MSKTKTELVRELALLVARIAERKSGLLTDEELGELTRATIWLDHYTITESMIKSLKRIAEKYCS